MQPDHGSSTSMDGQQWLVGFAIFLTKRRMVMKLDSLEGIDEIGISAIEVELMSSYFSSEAAYSLEGTGNMSQDMFARDYDGNVLLA